VYGLEELLIVNRSIIVCLGMEQADIHATRYRNSLTAVFSIVKNLMGGFEKRKLFSS
jgi:hypothetical protein